MHKRTRFPSVWGALGALLLVVGCGAQDGGSSPRSTPPRTPLPGPTPPPGPTSPTDFKCEAPCYLAFLTPAQAVVREQCSREVVVQFERAPNEPLRQNRAVTLTLSGGESFYADAACTQPISSVTIPAGESTAHYFFKEATVGTVHHWVSAGGNYLASQLHTITDRQPSPGPLASTCRLQFPPAAGIPCGIDTPGTQYYVSASRGDDGNPGTSAEHPWATLAHALQAAPDGSTVRVAAGTYPESPEFEMALRRPLTVKGGFDDTFSEWNPDRFHTTYSGPVTLMHDGATFGGFRLVARPPPDWLWALGYHRVQAGTLIRSYVEVIYSTRDTNYVMGVDVTAAEGRTSRVLCNDIYVRGATTFGFLALHALELSSHSGTTEVSSNRICADHVPAPWMNEAIHSNGNCSSTNTPARITLTNNIIEVVQLNEDRGHVAAMHFSECDSDMDVILTNNTVLSSRYGLSGGSNEGRGTTRWKLMNNIFFSEGSQRAAAGLGGQPILESGGNLVFGYADNRLLPAPASSAADDTTGTATAGTVFQDLTRGDFQPRQGGPAVGTGINVHGNTAYGAVTRDLAQRARPVDGAWDRGALLSPAAGD
ncbi:hypothetical protein [Myxococcus sp. RHSTA-1-4]|uniref:hypothetical protein n=1 Tax=Myxococcus sp. RHSTA-1-4 TaxID=2874601 RepID=UPI001CBBC892|nr:hypothetical protein [Myxococcus sp. RHSTA-1-4]MBZ4416306.1 hypothetical protein [Myxococcus sp. RHSTA-1-4]